MHVSRANGLAIVSEAAPALSLTSGDSRQNPRGDSVEVGFQLSMTVDVLHEPRSFLGVTVSSTFTDLERHRSALIRIIAGFGLKSIAMEDDSAKPRGDVLDSSLQMVRDGAAYVGLIGHKYGQVPACPRRNPRELSITQLEFNEAERLKRPILLFIAGENHAVRPSDVDVDPEKRKKLADFRDSAKRVQGSAVHRVYAVFDSLEEFERKAAQSIAELHRYLHAQGNKTAAPSPGRLSGQAHAAPDGRLQQPDADTFPLAMAQDAPTSGTMDAVSNPARDARWVQVAIGALIGGALLTLLLLLLLRR